MLVRDYSARRPHWTEGVVTHVLGPTTYEVHIPDLQLTWKRHVDQMVHCPESLTSTTVAQMMETGVEPQHINTERVPCAYPLPAAPTTPTPFDSSEPPPSDVNLNADSSDAQMVPNDEPRNAPQPLQEPALQQEASADQVLLRSGRVSKPPMRLDL